AWQARPPGGTRAIDPGVPADSELLDARGCATCHAEIAREWSQSRHALAWTNGIFQREYSARPQPWCINCHAPLTTQQQALDGARAAQGVDCATCHVRGGRLVSARRSNRSPHGTIADASFGTPAFCADCHQFTFPVLDETGRATAMTAHPMQTTVSSFAAGPFAHERDGCMTCHGSPRGHAFPGAHDRGMREAALELSWCRAGDALVVDVKNVAAGHTVPTGDIHRHLYLRVWRASAPEAMFQAFFGRRFEPADGGGKHTVWDSTIAPGETKSFDVGLAALAGEPGEPVNIELVYVFIESEFPRTSSEPSTASIRRERVETLPSCAIDRARNRSAQRDR
ncbi:MAG TPA: multiheme c-type cytochrome, partial [Kofleriaceae bacterium]|nr:multiheme c-type cytochrome [Kofleriaceae bacterium]